MTRKTKKHFCRSVLWETDTHSWSADIFDSGGVTHTVYVEYYNDDEQVRYDKTFTGENASQRAYDYVDQQRAWSQLPESKFMETADEKNL